MRRSTVELRAAQRLARAGMGCLMCGREDIGRGERFCGRCRREICPTPLDLYLDAVGMTAREFAEFNRMPVRTVLRAAKGQRMSRRVARRLAKITKMPEESFRP